MRSSVVHRDVQSRLLQPRVQNWLVVAATFGQDHETGHTLTLDTLDDWVRSEPERLAFVLLDERMQSMWDHPHMNRNNRIYWETVDHLMSTSSEPWCIPGLCLILWPLPLATHMLHEFEGRDLPLDATHNPVAWASWVLKRATASYPESPPAFLRDFVRLSAHDLVSTAVIRFPTNDPTYFHFWIRPHGVQWAWNPSAPRVLWDTLGIDSQAHLMRIHVPCLHGRKDERPKAASFVRMVHVYPSDQAFPEGCRAVAQPANDGFDWQIPMTRMRKCLEDMWSSDRFVCIKEGTWESLFALIVFSRSYCNLFRALARGPPLPRGLVRLHGVRVSPEPRRLESIMDGLAVDAETFFSSSNHTDNDHDSSVVWKVVLVRDLLATVLDLYDRFGLMHGDIKRKNVVVRFEKLDATYADPRPAMEFVLVDLDSMGRLHRSYTLMATFDDVSQYAVDRFESEYSSIVRPTLLLGDLFRVGLTLHHIHNAVDTLREIVRYGKTQSMLGSSQNQESPPFALPPGATVDSLWDNHCTRIRYATARTRAHENVDDERGEALHIVEDAIDLCTTELKEREAAARQLLERCQRFCRDHAAFVCTHTIRAHPLGHVAFQSHPSLRDGMCNVTWRTPRQDSDVMADACAQWVPQQVAPSDTAVWMERSDEPDVPRSTLPVSRRLATKICVWGCVLSAFVAALVCIKMYA